MTARIASRLWRANERLVLHGVALRAQDEHPLVDDVAEKRGTRRGRLTLVRECRPNRRSPA